MTTFNEQKVLFTITFDDVETLDALAKLGENGKKVYIEFELRMPRTDIRTQVHNDNQSIELKKFISNK